MPKGQIFVSGSTYEWVSEAATEQIRVHWPMYYLAGIRRWANEELSKRSGQGQPSMEGQRGKDTAKHFYLHRGQNRRRRDEVCVNLPPSNFSRSITTLPQLLQHCPLL